MSETNQAGAESASEAPGPGYAESMNEISTILAQLEGGNVDIDALAEMVKRAAHLIDGCRSKLTAAEASVTLIVNQLEAPVSPAQAVPTQAGDGTVRF